MARVDRYGSPRLCSVLGCYTEAAPNSFSQFCRHHRGRDRSEGHPEGNAIPYKRFDLWRRHTKIWCDTQEGHRGIATAIQVLDSMISHAPVPTEWRKGMTPRQATDYWLGLGADRLHIDGRKLFDGLVAIYALRASKDIHFCSDRHFRLASSNRLMGLATRNKCGALPRGHKTPSLVPVAHREAYWKRLNSQCGVLALRCAEEVIASRERFRIATMPVFGSYDDFDTSKYPAI